MLRRSLKKLSVLLLVGVMLLCASAEAFAAPEGLELTDKEREYIDSHDVLKVGYVQDRIPVSFMDENGELAGISRYIFDEISRISGLQFEYVALPNGSVTYDYLMGEGFDLVSSVEYNAENKGARGIMMSEPYLKSRKVVVARMDLDFSYSAPLSVAISSGSQTIRKVMGEAYPNFSLVDYDSIDACFDAVDKGQADMMIINQYVAEYWLYRPAYEDMKVIPVLGMDDMLCFSAVVPFDENGAPVGEDGGTVISILDKAIAQMSEAEVDSFTIQAIMENRYSFTTRDFVYRYRYTIIALSASAVLIAALLVLLARQRILSAEARADAKARSQFLSTMSHEVRTPLNGLIGLNYLMAHNLNDSAQLSRYLDQSTLTAKYLLSLVSDILDMSMLHNQDVQIERKPMDLQVLLSTVEAIVRSGMEEKEIDFQMHVELPYPNVVGDGVRVQQVLLNLLDNARKFTPPGGKVTVDVRQTVASSGEVRTYMDVSDSGKGMSESFQKNIFEAFVQERDTVSKGDQGVGLGLAICHRLARLMGGDISFSSVLDKGSVFTFFFTAPLSGEKTGTGDAAPAAREDLPGVLVAEDNELNGEIMLDVLAESGFQADLAENGREALERFAASAEGTYGVILMDLLMPEMDGFAAARAIRALDRPDAKTVRIFACSANCTEEDRQRAFDSGMDDFLAKPVDIDVLLQKLSGR